MNGPIEGGETATPLDTITPTAPVGFDPSASKAVLGTVLGALAIIVSSTGTVVGFMTAHDMVALFKWLHETEGLAYVSAVTLIGTLGWRITASFRKHVKALIAARAADSRIAFVRGEDEPSA